MKYCHRDYLFLERTIKRASRALDLHNVENNILKARGEVLLILNIERKTTKKPQSRKGEDIKGGKEQNGREVFVLLGFNFNGKLLSSHQFGKYYFSSHAKF